MNIQGKRVLITGGSSGIGLALARALLAKGAKVVISGRHEFLNHTALPVESSTLSTTTH